MTFSAGCYPGRDAKNEGRAEGFRFLFENDMFSGHRLRGSDAGSDRWYTSGLKLIATECPTPPDENPRVGGRVMSRLADFFLGREHQFGYTLGQLIYTPERLDVLEPQPADRFWGGYLYLGTIAQRENETDVETIEVDVGVIGRYAYAEQAQTLIHKWRDFDLPQGWSNQLRSEPTINAHYLRVGKGRLQARLASRLQGDVTPHYGVAVGTVFNYVHGGATLRLGDDLRAAPAATIEIPSLGAMSEFEHRWNIFARLDLRITAYNAFIDGGMLHGEPHPTLTRLEPVTFMLNRGLSFETKDWRVTILFNRRSREFNHIPGSRSIHSFGTVNFEYRFDRAGR